MQELNTRLDRMNWALSIIDNDKRFKRETSWSYKFAGPWEYDPKSIVIWDHTKHPLNARLICDFADKYGNMSDYTYEERERKMKLQDKIPGLIIANLASKMEDKTPFIYFATGLDYTSNKEDLMKGHFEIYNTFRYFVNEPGPEQFADEITAPAIKRMITLLCNEVDYEVNNACDLEARIIGKEIERKKKLRLKEIRQAGENYEA